MLGLDAAGKTTVLYKLKLGDLVNTIPTIGFNVEMVKYKSLEMTIWDVGGQDKIRPLWRHYYDGTDAVIWLVDSNDESRLQEAQAELHQVMAEDQLRNAVLLVLANKQDLPHALRPNKVSEALHLYNLPQRNNWYLQPCSAATGDGLYEGLDWLHKTLKARSAASAA